MNLIEFFGRRVKPAITKGKRMWKPLPTGWIAENILAIRDKDVNCFLIADGEGYIAIDSGYKDGEAIATALEKYKISNKAIKSVFLTHLDLDHAGGMDCRGQVVYPKAKIYLSNEEVKYLEGQYCRKKIAFYSCKMPIQLSPDYITFSDRDILVFENIKLQAVFTPGHTLGHTSFLLNDNTLFSGDCLISNEFGGYCFYDFWNADSVLNIKTLKMLKSYCNEHEVDIIITSHSGKIETKQAFLHMEEMPYWKKKGFQFITEAEDNPY